MPDSPADPSATGAGTPATAATPAAAAPPSPAPAEPDWTALLDQAPADVLLRHRRVNGMVGEHAQRLATRDRERIEREAAERAQHDAEERLMREAEDNPFEFAQKWRTEKAKENAQKELADLRRNAQADMMRRVGESYGSVAEWRELSPEELAHLGDALAGKGEDDLLPAFNAAALDLVASKRARKQMERELEQRLASEKRAWLTEHEATRLARDDVPDLKGASTRGTIDIRNLSDKEFNKLYEQTFLR